MFVFSVIHPCFHSAAIQRFAELHEEEAGRHVMRTGVKVSSYLSPFARKSEGIIGQPEPQWLFHRPISALFRSGFEAGFVVDGFEEPGFPGRRHQRRRPLARHAGDSASHGRADEIDGRRSSPPLNKGVPSIGLGCMRLSTERDRDEASAPRRPARRLRRGRDSSRHRGRLLLGRHANAATTNGSSRARSPPGPAIDRACEWRPKAG